MKFYKTKARKIPGTSYSEVCKHAFAIYKAIKEKSKRRPYVRSAYFKKDKIFLDLFWQHLWSKENWRDRARRAKYFGAGIELIINCKLQPDSKRDPNKKSVILHRFLGSTPEDELFFVQIKEHKKTDQKFLISIFPWK